MGSGCENGVSPTNTSNRKAMNATAGTQGSVRERGTTAPSGQPSYAMGHGILVVMPAEERGDLSRRTENLAQNLGSAIRHRPKDGQQERRQQERAADLDDFAAKGVRALLVLEENAHVGIAGAIGALKHPA